jgi:GH24 family phage-related lysozyme (muramidase)
MKISSNGLNLIKEFEGCQLIAYKDSAGVWTIGWGTTSSDFDITGTYISKGMIISQDMADEWLEKSISNKYAPAVEKQCSYLNLNQNQIDALISFCYNLGEGSLNQLTSNKTRSIEEISKHITSYNKCKVNGEMKELAGLTRRRNAELSLFLSECPNNTDKPFLAHLIAKKDAVPLRSSKSHTDNNVITYFDYGTPVDLLNVEDGWGVIAQGYINLDDFTYSILKTVKTKKDAVPLRNSASHTADNVITYIDTGTPFEILEYSKEDSFGRAIQGWLNLEDCEEF